MKAGKQDDIPKEYLIVDNHVFLLGLDGLYRDAMKQHERGELLNCARRTAQALQIEPASMPVEGYYAEDELLTEYFLLMRALQDVSEGRKTEVARLRDFDRLLEVASAPLYGYPESNGILLPMGRDALYWALEETTPNWSVAQLTSAAYSTTDSRRAASTTGS